MRRPWGPLLCVLLAVLTAGCQVRVSTDVTVAEDGSGVVVLRLLADEELRDALDEAGIAFDEGLAEAAEGASWSAEVVDDEDGAGVELRTRFDEPGELGERVEALFSGLAVDDGALLRDVELTRTDDGGYAFAASAGLDPPQVVGALPTDPDAPVRFDGEDLARVLREAGDQYARHDLRVTFPSVPVAPDAEVTTTSATWSLPVDGLAEVEATAPPVPVDLTTALLAAGALAAALLAAFATRALRARR